MNALFDPERLAALARLSAETRAAGAPPPFAAPVVIDERGIAWLPDPNPDPDARGDAIGLHAHPGLRVGWAPMPGYLGGGVLLTLFGGPAAEPGFEEDGVAALLTTAGLAALITDLRAIAASLEVTK